MAGAEEKDGSATPHGASMYSSAGVGAAALALVVFALAAALVMSDLAGRDPTRFAIANVVEESAFGTGKQAWDLLGITDLRFVTWQLARNARTLPTAPGRFFDGEMCYPAEQVMAFGPSAFTLGTLAIPGYWLTRDPVFTWNWTLFASALAAALAMFLLVREWTGVPSAAIAAGLLYAFHEAKLGDAIHLYVWDNAWTVFALFFATRWFRTHRWRDAAGLLASTVLQIGGDLYPLVAAAVIGTPYALHQLWRHRALPPLAQCAAVVAGVGVAAWLLLGPYFGGVEAGALQATELQFFRPIEWLMPGAGGSFGLVMTVGMLAALALPARHLLAGAGDASDPRGTNGSNEAEPANEAKAAAPKRRIDPRWVLLGAGLVIAALSIIPGDGTADPVVGIARDDGRFNLYIALARLVPGLEVGRSPGAVYTGAHLVWSALAGLGLAGLLRLAPLRYRRLLAAAFVLLAFVDTLRPGFLGLEPRYRHRAVELRPPDETLSFFEALARKGNDGPLLELPMVQLNFQRASQAVLNSAYHGRPTGHCYNSFYPEVTQRVEALAAQLPDAASLESLRALGFTTLIVHHPHHDRFLQDRRRRFANFENAPEGRRLLRRIHATDLHTAYQMLDIAP